MSWANVRELLLQERKLLDPGGILEFPQENAFESHHSALLGCYLRTKSAVDAAIHEFAETLEWPELSPLEKFFLVARLDFAWEMASILNTTPGDEPLIEYPAPERCSTAELLKWLLIDTWPYGCGRFLQAQKYLAEEGRLEQKRADPKVAPPKCVA